MDDKTVWRNFDAVALGKKRFAYYMLKYDLCRTNYLEWQKRQADLRESIAVQI
ncbi:MAG: hypothetical protein LBB90_06140 [Tannerella sp.]|jgi:hypothetical protein|nr:hypothetical protein [Tannerella sp.]